MVVYVVVVVWHITPLMCECSIGVAAVVLLTLLKLVRVLLDGRGRSDEGWNGECENGEAEEDAR